MKSLKEKQTKVDKKLSKTRKKLMVNQMFQEWFV